MSDIADTGHNDMPDGRFWKGFWGRMGVGVFLTLVIFAAWVLSMPDGERTSGLA